jgi:hypothetical protein
VQITVRHNFADVQHRLDSLQAGIRDAALASSINKTLDIAKTAMVRGITSEFNVKAGYVRERLRVIRASRKGGSTFSIVGTLDGSGKRGRSANIIAFVERSTSFAQAKKRRKAGTLNQLFVKVKRAGGVKPLRNAFIGNKGRTVFERIPGTTMGSRARYSGTKHAEQIKPVQVIDVPQMFNTKRINQAVVATLRARFPLIFDRDVRFYTDRFSKK